MDLRVTGAFWLSILLIIGGCRAPEGPPAADRPHLPVVAAVDTTGLEPVTVSQAMVVSSHPDASRVGFEVLEAGGNAVDAAVATAFAIAVTLPYAGNVGGGGFMVIRYPDGRATTIDFREVAPMAAHRELYLRDDGTPDRRLTRAGHLAVAVPATPAGLLMALERHGSLDRAAVLDPAIALATDGFRITERQARRLNRYRGDFEQFESTRRYFVKAGGRSFAAGETFVQADLGAVLQRIRDRGRDGFYRGETADLIVAEMQRGGGIITHDDLASYEAIERPALEGTYRDYRVITMPPPSGGGIILLQLLNAVEPVTYGDYGFLSPRAVHRAAEAMRRSFADRSAWLGDPDHVDVPVSGLVSKAYMRSRMAGFNPGRTTPSTRVQPGQPPGAPPLETAAAPPREGTETTHLSVVDANGMAVSLTTTVNDWYGSKVVVDGAGFFLNNIMDDFSLAPDEPDMWEGVSGERNALAPGRRMLSSMTPTIVADRQGRVVLVAGTRGGTTIPTQIFQTVTGVLDFDLSIQDVLEAPRFHHQWDPDALHYERGFDANVLETLRSKGWRLRERSGASGAVAAIHVTYDRDGTATITGARDPRQDVTPVGR